MKKFLIIALALCLLFLVGCGSLAGTSTPSSTPAAQTTSTVTSNSPQAVCRVLQAQQAQYNQAIHAASERISTAHGDQIIVVQAEKTLVRLHWLLAQGQADLKACKATR